jgi:hypothetical protein
MLIVRISGHRRNNEVWPTFFTWKVQASSGSIAVRKDGGNPRAGLIGMIGIMLNV